MRLYGPDGAVLPPVRRTITGVGAALGPVRLPAPSELPDWQAWVHRLWGTPNERVSWLHLDWYDDEGINRLVLWQVTPIERCTAFIREMLCGPPPSRDSMGRQLGPSMVRLQWDLCQKLHGYAQAYWIIQGTKGGHKRRFTHIESSMLKMAGLPTDPPVAGTLPYAPFDERVVAQVAQLDKMATWNYCHEFAERRPEELDAEDQATMQAMRRDHLHWLEQQVDAAFDGLTRADLASIPTSRDTQPIDWAAATEDLLQRE